MPYVQVYVDNADVLEKMSDDDLIKEMGLRGFKCAKEAPPITMDGIEHIEHLVLCGLYADARQEALQMIERQIERPNTLTAH